MPRFIILSIVILSATAASPPPNVGFYPINLCPYGPNNISTATTANSTPSSATAAFLATNANAATWAGTSASTCPQRLAPGPQVVLVTSFSRAQQNSVADVPRSKLYSLSLFRSSTVASAHIDFAIRDAMGTVVVPRMQLTLQPRPALVSSRRDLIKQASDATEVPTAQRKKGKRVLLQSLHTASEDAFEVPAVPQRAAKGGRRKGKGFSGGIGGGGRYGGGSGGFRQAGASSASKTYGYNSKALNSRYATYSRTPYGYSGRSVYYGGYPMYMYMGGYHGMYHGRHYQSCSSYYGSSAARCRQQYSGCQPVNSSCEVAATTALHRDDIMEAAVDTSTAMFPLHVEFYSATIAWQQGAVPEGWEMPLSFGFSEVDLDEEDDAALSWLNLIFILIIPCCCVSCCCYFLVVEVRRRRRAAAAARNFTHETSVRMEKQDSKELDIEAAVLPAYPVPAAVGTPISMKEEGRTCSDEHPMAAPQDVWKDEGQPTSIPAPPEVLAEYIQPATAKPQPA